MIIVLFFLVGLLYLKWIIIFLIFPFQVLSGQIDKYVGQDLNVFHRILKFPFTFIEKRIFRKGWERFMIFQIGDIPSHHIRSILYKSLGARICKNVVFHFRTEIRIPANLYVGQGSIIGDYAILDARNGLFIGDNVCLASKVSIWTEQHDHRDPFFRCNSQIKKNVKICDRAWIGSNVTILPGVTIGEGAVCCAGCVVTKDVEPYSVVAGIPAKKVNERPHNLKYEFKGYSCRLY